MATIFSAPTIGEPRAVGTKNGGVSQVETDIVRPMTRLSTDDDTFLPGKQLEFRWRSDSSRYWSPRDTRLYVRYRLQFGEPEDTGPGSRPPLDMTKVSNRDKVKSVRVTAAPNTALFDGGMRYLQNNVTIEHQSQPYTAAMAQLLTKTDIAGTDTGSAGLLSLRKDVGRSLVSGQVDAVATTTAAGAVAGTLGTPGTYTNVATSSSGRGSGLRLTFTVPESSTNPAVGNGVTLDSIEIIDRGSGYKEGDTITLDTSAEGFPAGLATLADFRTRVTGLFDLQQRNNTKSDNINPKQEIVTAGVDGNSTTFEYMQPMFLASWQHGFAVGPSDHQLFLTISNYWEKDLLHCARIGNEEERRYTETQVGTSTSKNADIDTATVRVYVEDVELHIAYARPTQQFIPPSQSLRFSQYQVDMRVVDSKNVNESLVVNPGTRQLLFGMRQESHGIDRDREEFGLAMAGIDEAGTGQPVRFFTDFQAQLGGVVAPTIAFSNMNPGKAHMARPYQEFLNVIGKPLGLRGNTFSYAEYIGSHNSNGESGPGLGDHGPIIALRLLTPDSELSNELQIRGALNAHPETDALQQMVIITVADRLLDVAYAPPQEIPVSTAVNDLL